MWFGSEGVQNVVRPDRAMLAAVPFMNVQEVFIFGFYFAFVLRLCVFCSAARIFIEKAVGLRIPQWLIYAITAAACYVFYVVPYGNGEAVSEWKLMSAIFIGSILAYVQKNFGKKQLIDGGKL